MEHTVLVVEDETGIRKAICIYMKNQGYRVLDAANGKLHVGRGFIPILVNEGQNGAKRPVGPFPVKLRLGVQAILKPVSGLLVPVLAPLIVIIVINVQKLRQMKVCGLRVLPVNRGVHMGHVPFLCVLQYVEGLAAKLPRLMGRRVHE